jgi:hypothetical protein
MVGFLPVFGRLLSQPISSLLAVIGWMASAPRSPAGRRLRPRGQPLARGPPSRDQGHHADGVRGPRHRADGAARWSVWLPREGHGSGAFGACAPCCGGGRRGSRPRHGPSGHGTGDDPPPHVESAVRGAHRAGVPHSRPRGPRPRQPGDRTRLVLSPKTVRNHVSNVLTKLHVADRSQAIVLGRQRGLGQGSTSPDVRPPRPRQDRTFLERRELRPLGRSSTMRVRAVVDETLGQNAEDWLRTEGVS